MSNENSPPPSPSARRASFSPGQKFSDLFGRSASGSGGTAGTSAYPGSIATAAANAQKHQGRRLSISTLGLSGSPTQTSSFAGSLTRGESCSSGRSGSPSIDENAIEEGDAGPNPAPSSPFARRMSFGARALRDVRTGNGNFNGRASTNLTSPPPAHRRVLSSNQTSTSENPKRVSNDLSRRSGEGFNWSDQLRSRAERSSSITNPTNPPAPAAPQEHQRAVSTSVMEAPVKEMPKTPKAPDHFQERILKGDFYMD